MKRTILRLGVRLCLAWAIGTVASAASFRLEQDTVVVPEDAGHVSLNVLLSSALDHEATVVCSTLDGHAKSDADYQAVHVKPGHTYVLECSEDLHTWTPVSTNTAAASELWFDDLDAPGNTRRFFRTVER